VDLLPPQAMVTPARKIERLEKQTDMKVVAGARYANFRRRRALLPAA